jgi:hypothetical protein
MYGVKPEIRAFQKVPGFFQYSYGFFNYFSCTIPSKGDILSLISRIPLGMGGCKAHLPLNEQEIPVVKNGFT